MNNVSPLRCLSQIFLPKTTKATAAVPSAPTKDEIIQNVVDQFKKKSNQNKFRRQRLSYKITVSRLAKAGHFSSVRDILDHQKVYPDIKDEHFTARLICLYGEAKMSDYALQLFDEMPDLNCPRTVLSFNALLAAYFPTKKFDIIVELFQELPGKLSIKPNVISYTSVIKAFCEMGSFDSAISMLEDMEKNDVAPNATTFGSLLDAFYVNGRLSEAENIWNLMEEKEVIPDLRCYNSRLYGMVKEKRLSEAMEVFNELNDKGLKPNTCTYNCLIKGFVTEGNLKETKKWYTTMLESGCSPNSPTFSILISFACDNDDIDFAYELCKRSFNPKKKLSTKVIKKVINNLVEQSKVDKARELLELDNSNRKLLLDKLIPSAVD
ncbi:hypothetical protein CDL12_27310 [Handroanthus impetiginosus]|uniref:Pentacotripeptide-repeat region of PRORP domain-containing protein n=1 Tax=Handroanthus impetiginosus TaxID=429701 RepID=A0A2G9G4S0_9LAMI|nr:hypothetical protein CDL12_27310 [Handroanthus impetiginosus]